MADGRTTDERPCIVGPWMLRDGGGAGIFWKDVEFVVLDGHQGDAFLGLPLLKRTQIIHSSSGKLLFAEYEEVLRKEGAPCPIYYDGLGQPTESNIAGGDL